MVYNNVTQAKRDLKEAFLATDLSQTRKYTEGWPQAVAVQALENMSENEILLFVNNKHPSSEKLWAAYRFQSVLNRKTAREEATIPTKEIISNRHALIPLLKENKKIIKEFSKEERIQYVRAFQKVYEHIEHYPLFKRPIKSAENVQYKQDMLDGLLVSTPRGLIQTVQKLEESPANEWNYALDAFALLAKTAQGEHLEQQVIQNGKVATASAATAITCAIASIPVTTHLPKEHTEKGLYTGAGLFILAGLVSLIYLLKQNKKLNTLSHKYKFIAKKLGIDSKMRNHYHQLQHRLG